MVGWSLEVCFGLMERDLLECPSSWWSSGRLLIWDKTCSDYFAPSNLLATVNEAGTVAVQVKMLKNVKRT